MSGEHLGIEIFQKTGVLSHKRRSYAPPLPNFRLLP